MSDHLPALQAVIKFARQGKKNSALGSLKMLKWKFIKDIDPTFRGTKQQDASEFLNQFLSRISDDISRIRSRFFSCDYEENSKNLVENNFEVVLAENNTCKE